MIFCLHPGFGVWPHSELSPTLLESSEDSLAQRASRRLHPLPRPQIIGPIHLGAGNLHTAQEVMDGSSKPVWLSRAQLSISMGHLSFCLLAGGRLSCALHPGSSKAPLQATLPSLSNPQDCSFPAVPGSTFPCLHGSVTQSGHSSVPKIN